MNEYLKIFQNVEQSVDQLLRSEYHSINSIEIRESAENLKLSIQPCTEELRISAYKLKELIKHCFNDLDEAEDVWNNKIRISGFPQEKIWEQIGEVSAYYFKIQNLANKQKLKLMEESRVSWNKNIEEVKKKWFLDEKNQMKSGVGWHRKEDFTKYMLSVMMMHFQMLQKYIKTSLRLAFVEIDNQYKIFIKLHATLPDARNEAKLIENKLMKAMQEIKEKCDLNPNFSIVFLKEIFSPTFNVWKNKRSDISWIDVDRLKDEVIEKGDQRINLIMDSRINLMKQTLDKVIAFYNDFLEQQERYQQETPEQRLAEKAWIDHQRQELEKLQASFNSVLEIPAD